MKRKIRKYLLTALIATGLLATSVTGVFATEAVSENDMPKISVSEDSIELQAADDSSPITIDTTLDVKLSTTDGAANYKAFRSALERASESATLTIRLLHTDGTSAAGKVYPVDGYGLVIRSNTVIDMGGATLKAVGETLKHNFFNNGDMNGEHTSKAAGYQLPGGYGLTHDIVLKNGVIDGNSQNTNELNLVTFGHASGITVSNVDFKYCKGNHLLEITGCENVLIENCEFDGYMAGTAVDEDEEDGLCAKEAIEIDIPSSKYNWVGSYDGDDTVCRNITVTDCVFRDYPCGVGDHHSVPNAHSSNITIKNNKFVYSLAEPAGCAIRTYAFDNCVIENNTITGNYFTPIKVYGGIGTRIEGNTIKKAGGRGIAIADSRAQGTKVDEPAKNVTVKANTITSTDTSIHVFAKSEVTGISNNTLISSTGYGLLINDDAKVGNVTGNTITSQKGYGVSVAEAAVTAIEMNTITAPNGTALFLVKGTTIKSLNKNTIKGAKYGVQLSASDIETVTGNKVTSGNNYAFAVTKGAVVKKLGGSKSAKNTIQSSKAVAVTVAGSKSRVIDMSYNVIKAPNSKKGMALSVTGKGKVDKFHSNTVTAGYVGVRVATKGVMGYIGNKSKSKGNKITAGKWGVYVNGKGSKVNYIMGNTIVSKKDKGIFLTTGALTKDIASNTITAKKGSGIFTNSATVTNIRKNTIKSAKLYSIAITGTSKINAITNNTLSKKSKKPLYIVSKSKVKKNKSNKKK